MSPELFLTNIGFGVTIPICFALGLFVYVRGPKEYKLNTLFFLLSLCICLWQLSYVLGINIKDPDISRLAFMFNMVTLPMVAVSIHIVLAVSRRVDDQKAILWIFYALSFCLVAFFVVFPDTFLLPSVPKLYYPNFFVPGPFYFLSDILFFGGSIYLFMQIYIGYRGADFPLKNRLTYFFLSFIIGYILGSIPIFLLYDVPIDPLISSLTGLYTVPMVYAIIWRDAININLLTKKTLGYGILVAGVTLFILLVGYANEAVIKIFPTVPEWVFPLFSGIVAVSVGVFIWHKIREVDKLKFEFIDVVTHKFRTPLTHIRWSVDTLRSTEVPEERARAVDDIQTAGTHLFELTDILVGLTESDNEHYLYSYAEERVDDCVRKIVDDAKDLLRDKKLEVDMQIPSSLPPVYINRRRVDFAIQVILENAIMYSPVGGRIGIGADRKGEHVVVSIRDTGIGIAKDDLKKIFSKFYRGSNATHVHTEGMGIGLYMSRSIMQRQGGDVWVESEGEGKGSTFFIKMPVKK